MSVATLNGNYYWSAPFTVPQNKTVIIDMEAGGLVDMYVLWNEQELTAFKNGQRPYHRAALGVRNYYNKINLASLGPPIIPPNALSSPSTPSLAGIALLSGLFGPPFQIQHGIWSSSTDPKQNPFRSSIASITHEDSSLVIS